MTEDFYQQRRDHAMVERDYWTRRSDRLSNLRLLTFVGLMVCVGTALFSSAWWWLGALLFLIAFIAQLLRHQMIETRKQRAEALVKLNEYGLARIKRDWQHLPERQPSFAVSHDSYANDLDVFGHASLLHMLGSSMTALGLDTLAHWLIKPATVPLIHARQQAVLELAPEVNLRDELHVQALTISANKHDFEQFLAWTEQPPTMQRWMLIAAWLLPLLPIGALLGYIVGRIQHHYWLPLAILNIILANLIGASANRAIVAVSARRNGFAGFGALFKLINDANLHAPLLKTYQARLHANDQRADVHMAKLGRILSYADQRFSYLYVILQAFTLWNVHVGWALERWQDQVRGSARDWLATLGDIEALATFAMLQHDQPTWTMPHFHAKKQILTRQMQHPLLASNIAVPNDLTVGEQLVMITGSNMAGKSTLLRALGLNIVLAQAGAPVAASSFVLPPTTLATAIRINDSLEQGVSYFMAELLRLKWVIEVAQRTKQRAVVFLLDEILHGTNTTERTIAARHIIKLLRELGAIGIVSTHDLALATAPDVAAVSDQWYLTEQFSRDAHGKPTMNFDYKLRHGLAPSTNALKLMEIVGLMENSEIKNQKSK